MARGYLCRLPALTCAALFLMALAGCAASSNGSPAEMRLPEGSLDWPPLDTATQRLASDDVFTVEGDDYGHSGGSVSSLVGSAEFDATGEFTFAMYSLGGFSGNITFGSLAVTSTASDLGGGDPTVLYAALANYATGRWQILQVVDGSWQFNPVNGEDYHSPSGIVHVALVHSGDGEILIDKLDFGRLGNLNAPPAPANLVGVQQVQLIELDWDDVPDVIGYNVYRSLEPDFSDPVLVNESPVALSEFDDDTVGTHKIYYYCVTAVGAEESEYSNQIDIFSPRADLAFPGNVTIEESTLVSVKISWTWDDANPGGWVLYFKQGVNFNLNPVITQKSLPPFARSYTFNELEPGQSISFRMAARTGSGDIGRMIDDFPLLADTLWEWGPVETVGAGSGPIEAITADGDLTATYVNGNSQAVARRAAGTWSTEDVLVVIPNVARTGFGRFLDIAHGGGNYIVTGYAKAEDDLYGATGNPGNWDVERIDGDGSNALVHPAEGDSMRVAAKDDEYAILYQLGSVTSDPQTLALMTKSLPDGEWTREVVYNDNQVFVFNDHALAYEGDNLFALNTVPLTEEMLFGDRDGSWTWQDILPADTGVRTYNDLLNIAGTWYTPGYDVSNEQLFVYSGTTAPWSEEQVSFTGLPSGRNAEIIEHEGMPVVLFFGENPDQWYFAIDDGTGWKAQWIVIPDAEFSTNADLCSLNGSLHLIYEDLSDVTIKCAKGTPPA